MRRDAQQIAGNNQSSQVNFRRYLQEELARRCAANPQYSLRAFAFHLGINHSTLSQLQRGKRALTSRTIEKLGEKLGLEPAQVEAFVAHERLTTLESTSISRNIQQLTLDSVALLSDPCHRAIMELIHLDIFTPDVRWISRVINASIDDVVVALTRLLRLGLLEMSDPSLWLDRSDAVTDANENHFARRVIEQLSLRVRSFSPHEIRDSVAAAAKLPAVRLAIRPTDLPLVVETINKFQEKLARRLDHSEQKGLELYLEIVITPISN